MNILVVGLGYTGSCLAELALVDGHQVTGARRQNKFPQGITGVQIDLVTASSLDALPERPDAIAYLVGADAHSEQAYREAYQLGLRRVLEHYAPRLHSQDTRFVFASSTAVYGARAGWVDEETPAEAESFSGRVLRDAERSVWEHGGVVLRLGGIYGPGRTSFLQRVARGELTSSNAGARFTNRIHQVDVARAMLHLMQLATPEPLYLGVDEAPTPQREVVAWLESHLPAAAVAPDRGPPTTSPESSSPARKIEGPAPAPSGRVVADKRCSSKRLRASGFDFRYRSFREGYAPLIAALRPETD